MSRSLASLETSEFPPVILEIFMNGNPFLSILVRGSRRAANFGSLSPTIPFPLLLLLLRRRRRRSGDACLVPPGPSFAEANTVLGAALAAVREGELPPDGFSKQLPHGFPRVARMRGVPSAVTGSLHLRTGNAPYGSAGNLTLQVGTSSTDARTYLHVLRLTKRTNSPLFEP